jgi:hypothetical protein
VTTSDPALRDFLGEIDPAAHAAATALDQAARRAHPDFDVAVK